MRRWLAVLLLVVVATFLAVSGADRCDEDVHHHHQHAQHFLCPDDCAPALIPMAPVPPPPDPMPRILYEETVVRPILNLELEPEKAPPRA